MLGMFLLKNMLKVRLKFYTLGMKALGLENFNSTPAGYDTDNIILDTFVMEAYV